MVLPVGLPSFLGSFLICMHYGLSDILKIDHHFWGHDFEKLLTPGVGISTLWKRKIWKKRILENWTTIWKLYIFFCFHSITLFFVSIPLMYLLMCPLLFSSVSFIYFIVSLPIYCSIIQSRQAGFHWIYRRTCKMFNARAIKYSYFILRTLKTCNLSASTLN